jgi:hypothetical protein
MATFTNIYKKLETLIDWINQTKKHIEIMHRENQVITELLINLYEPAKIAVNQIVCIGGNEPCQPCVNRERLATALDSVKKYLFE